MLARQFADKVSDRYVNEDFETLQTDIAAFGLPINVQRLKDDMGKYRVEYDVWFSETSLHQSGAIADILDKLAQRGATLRKKTVLSGTGACCTAGSTAATK